MLIRKTASYSQLGLLFFQRSSSLFLAFIMLSCSGQFCYAGYLSDMWSSCFKKQESSQPVPHPVQNPSYWRIGNIVPDDIPSEDREAIEDIIRRRNTLKEENNGIEHTTESQSIASGSTHKVRKERLPKEVKKQKNKGAKTGERNTPLYKHMAELSKYLPTFAGEVEGALGLQSNKKTTPTLPLPPQQAAILALRQEPLSWWKNIENPKLFFADGKFKDIFFRSEGFLPFHRMVNTLPQKGAWSVPNDRHLTAQMPQRGEGQSYGLPASSSDASSSSLSYTAYEKLLYENIKQGMIESQLRDIVSPACARAASSLGASASPLWQVMPSIFVVDILWEAYTSGEIYQQCGLDIGEGKLFSSAPIKENFWEMGYRIESGVVQTAFSHQALVKTGDLLRWFHMPTRLQGARKAPLHVMLYLTAKGVGSLGARVGRDIYDAVVQGVGRFLSSHPSSSLGAWHDFPHQREEREQEAFWEKVTPVFLTECSVPQSVLVQASPYSVAESVMAAFFQPVGVGGKSTALVLFSEPLKGMDLRASLFQGKLTFSLSRPRSVPNFPWWWNPIKADKVTSYPMAERPLCSFKKSENGKNENTALSLFDKDEKVITTSLPESDGVPTLGHEPVLFSAGARAKGRQVLRSVCPFPVGNLEKMTELFRMSGLPATREEEKAMRGGEKGRVFHEGYSLSLISLSSHGHPRILAPSVSVEGEHIPEKQASKPTALCGGVTHESGRMVFSFPHVTPLKKKKEKKESLLAVLLKVLGIREILG